MHFFLYYQAAQDIIYVPPAPNVPLFKGKNEAQLSASIGGGDEFSSTSIQAAYSPVDHFAVYGNYMCAYNDKQFQIATEGNANRGSLYDVGAGMYFHAGDYFVYEFFAGTAYGDIFYSLGNTQPNQLRLRRNSLSFNAGFSFPYFEIAFSSALAMVHYTNLEMLYANTNITSYRYIPEDGFKYVFYEPGLTM